MSLNSNNQQNLLGFTPQLEKQLQSYQQALSLNQISIKQIQQTFSQFIYHYKKPLQNGDKTLYLICSIFISSKILKEQNVKGEILNKGNGISLSKIINQMDDELPINNFLQKLPTFLDNIDIQQDIKDQSIKQIQDGINKFEIFKKFTKVIQALKIKYTKNEIDFENIEDTISLEDYITNFKNFIWVLFLNHKNEIFQSMGDVVLIKDISVLISTLLLTFIYLPQDFTSTYLSEKLETDLSTIDERYKNIDKIRNEIKLLVDKQNTLEDKKLDYYEKKVNQQLDNCKKRLSKRKSIDLTSINNTTTTQSNSTQKDSKNNFQPEFQNIFKPSQITKLLTQFQNWYQSSLEEENDIEEEDEIQQKFDETCFIRLNKPQAPNKIDNQYELMQFSSEKQKNLPSSKHINFDEETKTNGNLIQTLQKGQISQIQGQNTPNITFKSMYQSPNVQKPPIYQDPPQTPVTQHLENFKWMNYFCKDDITQKLDSYLAKLDPTYKDVLIRKIKEITTLCLEKIDYGKIQDKSKGFYPNQKYSLNSGNIQQINKIKTFYCNVLEKMIDLEEKKLPNIQKAQQVIQQLLDNKDFLFSLLGICILTIIHIQSKDFISPSQILEPCEVKSKDIWRVISNFALFDKSMPQSIKEHLFNIERTILLYSIFEEDNNQSIIMMMLELFNQQEYQNKIQSQQETENKFRGNPPYSKILCKRIFYHTALRVYEVCQILDVPEKLQEDIWEIMKYIFEKQTNLFQYYIDQLIICSIYITYLQNKQKFMKQISFKSMISDFGNLEFFQKQKVRQSEFEGATIDLIQFYNKVFLPPIRNYVKVNKSALEHVLKKKRDDILQSPLNSSIPKQFFMYSPVCKKQQIQSPGFTQLTPRTKPLYALGESIESPQKTLDQQIQQAKNNLTKKNNFSSSKILNFNENTNNNQKQQQQNISQFKPTNSNLENYNNSNLQKDQNQNSPKFGNTQNQQQQDMESQQMSQQGELQFLSFGRQTQTQTQNSQQNISQFSMDIQQNKNKQK